MQTKKHVLAAKKKHQVGVATTQFALNATEVALLPSI